MSKQLSIKLTKSEINHILTLIEVNERDGWYYGMAEQYRNRSEVIKQKLQNQLSTKNQ